MHWLILLDSQPPKPPGAFVVCERHLTDTVGALRDHGRTGTTYPMSFIPRPCELCEANGSARRPAPVTQVDTNVFLSVN